MATDTPKKEKRIEYYVKVEGDLAKFNMLCAAEAGLEPHKFDVEADFTGVTHNELVELALKTVNIRYVQAKLRAEGVAGMATIASLNETYKVNVREMIDAVPSRGPKDPVKAGTALVSKCTPEQLAELERIILAARANR